MYRTVILFLSGLLALQVSAQSTVDSLQMDSVVILASRSSAFSAGIKTVHYDSASLNRFSNSGLNDLLAAESELFIKSYGPGSLATSSFRGAGGNHTAVVWNGISLISPTHGLTDLSLLPMLFVDEVSIQYGGSGTLWGSGNVGGAVLLNSKIPAGEGWRFDLSSNAGSFGNYQEAVRVQHAGKKADFSLRGFVQGGKNDFPYTNYNLSSLPLLHQYNAAVFQWGIMPEFAFRPNEKNEINVHGWIQYMERQIPPAMTQGATAAQQNDGNIRITANWNHYRDRSKFVFRTALLNDIIDYSDSLINLYSESRAWTLIAEGESTFRLFKGHLLQTGLINTFSKAYSETYPEGKEQNRTAVFANFAGEVLHERLHYSIGIREELVDGEFTPVIPSAGINFQFFNWFDLRLNGTRSYRLPTFNDLYWAPGGNPDLLPELGWSSDAGMSFHFKFYKWTLESDAGVFYRRMENWILWLPTAGGYWSPENVQEVLSRGIETAHSLGRNFGNWKLSCSVRSSYVISTNEKAASASDASLGKQLIYVPYNKTTASLMLQYKSWSIYSNYSFNGFRYTSSDNSEFLPGYNLYSARLSWQHKFKTNTVKAFAEANNIFDQPYEVIASRPMPGRNFRMGIQFSFTCKTKKEKTKPI